MFVSMFSACAQTPAENASPVNKRYSSKRQPKQETTFRYRVEVSSRIVGFNIMVNGADLMAADGGYDMTSSQIIINDWMVSGNNRLDITIFWPDGIKYAPGISSATFKLFSNDTLVKEFRWPAANMDAQKSYPHTFTEIFKAESFPNVLLERAERVISSAGVLPRKDQEEIAALAGQLRKAFTEKNIDSIGELFAAKYDDLAAARFTTTAAVKEEVDAKYRELMGKEGYTVNFNGRNSYFSAVDDRAVRLGQGRIGFPEPALIITWRENKKTVRWDMELYFAKIDGSWIIIR